MDYKQNRHEGQSLKVYCDLIGVQDIADERTIYKKLINEPIIIRNSIDPV